MSGPTEPGFGESPDVPGVLPAASSGPEAPASGRSGPEVPADGGPVPPPRRWATVAAAVGLGLGAGLLGTSLHGHLWYPGGVAIPLGAVTALMMLGAVELFVALWSRSAWTAVLCGAAAYLCAGVLSLQRGSYGMISANLQGTVWLFGIAVVTPFVAWLAWSVLRRQRN